LSMICVYGTDVGYLNCKDAIFTLIVIFKSSLIIQIISFFLDS